MTDTKTLKFIVCGASGAGKTALVERLTENRFSGDLEQTDSFEFKRLTTEADGHNVELQIWDLAGNEIYRSIMKPYMRRALGVALVFDITERATYDEINKWLEDVRALCDPSAAIILIGNKSDLSEKRVVTQSEAEQFARDHNLSYIESSALNGTNVREAFINTAVKICNKEEKNEDETNWDSLTDSRPTPVYRPLRSCRLKFDIFGAAKVGKSALATRVAEDTFSEQYRPTLCSDFTNAYMEIDDKKVQLHLSELAGDQRFQTDDRKMLLNPDAILLVFDITERATYDEINKWLDEAHALGEPSIPIVLIGNKSDLSEKRVVSQSEAEQFARDHNVSYIETSALNGTNVREMFIKTARDASESERTKRLERERQREMEEMEEKSKIEEAQKLKNDADQGDATAQKEYAECLMNGRGVERNASEAARYFKMSGDQGNLEALFNYAMLLAKGDGVEANLSEALRCIDTVAEKGPAEVKFVCGLLFADGESFTDDVKEAIPADLKTAARYWKMAADEGHAEAQRRLDELKDKLGEE